MGRPVREDAGDLPGVAAQVAARPVFRPCGFFAARPIPVLPEELYCPKSGSCAAASVVDWSGVEIGKFYRPVKKPVTMRLDSDVIGRLKNVASVDRILHAIFNGLNEKPDGKNRTLSPE